VKKEMATTVTIYRLCVDGDMENTKTKNKPTATKLH